LPNPCGGGSIYTSSDYAVTWTAVYPPAPRADCWISVAMSANGSVIAAVRSQTDISTIAMSWDYGVSWVEVQPLTLSLARWANVTMSADGKNVLATTANTATPYNDGTVFYSSNYGLPGSWSASSGNRYYVAYLTPNGQTLFSVATGGSRVFKSPFTALATSAVNLSPTTAYLGYTSIASSYDGSTRVIVANNNAKKGLWSVNMAASPNLQAVVGTDTTSWARVAMDYAGCVIASLQIPSIYSPFVGQIFIATNGTAPGTAVSGAAGTVPSSTKEWMAVSVSGLGNMVIVAGQGEIWTSP
jgi:hypothetical protein